MGRRRALAALVLAGALSGASAGDVPLREARWIAPEARFEQLSTTAGPCMVDPAEDAIFGRPLFADPLLLGGQAARAGLSCASCHRGGRNNPAFVFPGVSGPPGTADVTSSLFSSHRGDGSFNPKQIPDLTFDPPKVSRTESGALESFIRQLIVEEFDGPEPPKRIVERLAAYVRALDPKGCTPAEPLDLTEELHEYTLALGAVHSATRQTSPEAREVAIVAARAARSRLGAVAERYVDPALAEAQSALAEADATLARLQQQVREGSSREALRKTMDEAWHERETMWGPLSLAEEKSLYNPERLKAALNAARTP